MDEGPGATLSVLRHFFSLISICDRCTKVRAAATGAGKCGREELSHVCGQGQKPGGPRAQRVVAKRSYPTSEVRGSGRECQAVTAQEWLRGATQVRDQGRPGGATPRPRSGEAAGRSYPTPPHPRPGAAAGRTNPTSKEGWLLGRRRA